MEWLKLGLGITVVLFAVREIFQDLFHPTGTGALSEWVGRSLFRGLGRWRAMLPNAGPVAVLLVIYIWAILLVIGFALIYWSAFPAHFEFNINDQPTNADGFWWCAYYSLVMLTTLGLGDIQPSSNWLRLLSGFHALIGFSFLSASITWIVLLFPALRRARTLARKVHILKRAEKETSVSIASTGMHTVLAGLAEEVLRTRVDLVHFPILFYFYADDQRASLAEAMFPLMQFAEEGQKPERDDLIRLSAVALHDALGDLAAKVGERLELRDHSPEDIFRAFRELHRYS